MAAKPVDPFDLDALRLTPDQVAELVAKQAKPGQAVITTAGRARQQEGFVLMKHNAAKAGYLALGCPQALVWHYLHHRVWAADNRTVPVPNQALAEWGVSRWVKYRALQNLQDAGLIRVEWRKRKSPLVTLLTR
jgi:hypothetical protein